MSHCDTKTEKQQRFGRETSNFTGDELDAFGLNVTVVFYFKIIILHVPCHIVSLDREYLLHVH